jgi:poly(ADP-ribose) glycohydrolase
VQEEIRFAVAPELTAMLALCPVMMDNESIAVEGAPIVHQHVGYGFNLGYGSDIPLLPLPRASVHESAENDMNEGTEATEFTEAAEAAEGKEGSDVNDASDAAPTIDASRRPAIVAIDALCCPGSPQQQYAPRVMLREMRKALAGFSIPARERGRAPLTAVATGNWGCGAFGGFVDIKAIIQWLAASQAGRTVYYYPFSDSVGRRLAPLTAAVGEARGGITVGHVCRSLWELSEAVESGDDDGLNPCGWILATIKRV